MVTGAENIDKRGGRWEVERGGGRDESEGDGAGGGRWKSDASLGESWMTLLTPLNKQN